MVWGAAWLYKALNESSYWDFVKANIQSLESHVSGGNFAEFGWDAKNAGINVLVSKVSNCS